LILGLKVRYPKHVHLLRGNNESSNINEDSYNSLYEDIVRYYGEEQLYYSFCEVFNYLPIAAVVDDDIFCVHGGLSPEIRFVDDIDDLDRFCEIPEDGPLCDFIWGDPEENLETPWVPSPRGAGWLFGSDVTKEFLAKNNLKYIVRGHQCTEKGYHWYHDNTILTIWSAPNYRGRCGNEAAILKISPTVGDEHLQIITFVETKSTAEPHIIPYFV